jgi:hypothetical protein
MREKGTLWVVFDSSIGKAVCRRCKQQLEMELPQPLSVFVAATKAFCKLHKNCEETAKNTEREG